MVDRLTRIGNDAGSLHRTDGPDPVFSLKLSTFDPERWLDLVPHNETATGVLQQIVRDLVCAELGLGGRTRSATCRGARVAWTPASGRHEVRQHPRPGLDARLGALRHRRGVAHRHRLPVRCGRVPPAVGQGAHRAARPGLAYGLLGAVLPDRRDDGSGRDRGEGELLAFWRRRPHQLGRRRLLGGRAAAGQALLPAAQGAADAGVARRAQAGVRRGEAATVRCGSRRGPGPADAGRWPGPARRPARRHAQGRVRQPDRRPAPLDLPGHAGLSGRREGGHPRRAGQGAALRAHRLDQPGRGRHCGQC